MGGRRRKLARSRKRAGSRSSLGQDEWAVLFMLVNEARGTEVLHQHGLALDATIGHLAHLIALEMLPTLSRKFLWLRMVWRSRKRGPKIQSAIAHVHVHKQRGNKMDTSTTKHMPPTCEGDN